MKRYFLLIVFSLTVSFFVNAQIIYFKESPLKLEGKSQVPLLQTPSLDIAKLQQEDKAKPLPYRVGKNFRFEKSLKKIADKVSYGDKNIWYLEVKAKNGQGLSLIFEKTKLPKGAKLFIYSVDGKYVVGPITYLNNKKSGILPVRYIPELDVIIEYQEPVVYQDQDNVFIKDVVVYYRGMQKGKGVGESGPCEVDINCPEGSAWQAEKHAVARIIFESGVNSYYCTGALVGNTAKTSDPYFLTANHCINTESSAQSAVFYFNFEYSQCGGGSYTSDQTVSGSDLVAEGSFDGTDHLDFTLLKLSSVPPITYSPYYAGWSRISSTSAIDSAVCIHHPQGDLKKISKTFHSLEIGSFSGYDTQTHWQVTQWDLGTTEGGSSGSPLFDNQRHIIGDLTGGEADCDNPVNDYFAQFYQSWDKYSDTTAQLKYWLDPLDLNPVFLDGYDPYNPNNNSLKPVRYFKAYLADTITHLLWLAPDQTDDSVLYDGFEKYADFSLSVPNWTEIDVDKAPTWGIEGVEFENENYVGAFIVFNSEKTKPAYPKGWLPHSGQKMLVCFDAQPDFAPNNDWLISPKMPITTSTKFVFYAKSVSDQYGLERIRVLVSEDSSLIKDFTPISKEPYLEVPTQWTKYEFDLSSYAGKKIYVAINVVSDNAFALLLDDISISPYPSQALKNIDIAGGQVTNFGRQAPTKDFSSLPKLVTPQLENYEVYRDFQLIATVDKSQNYYLDTIPSKTKAFSYYVVAKYDSGRAEPTNVLQVKYIEDTVTTYEHDNSVSVFPNPATGGYFTIKFIRPIEEAVLTVTSLSGKVVYKREIKNEQILHINALPIQAGVYVISVRTPKEVYKTVFINL